MFLDETLHPTPGRNSYVPTRCAPVNETRSYDSSAVSGKTLFDYSVQAGWDLWRLLGVCYEPSSEHSCVPSKAAALEAAPNSRLWSFAAHHFKHVHSVHLTP